MILIEEVHFFCFVHSLFYFILPSPCRRELNENDQTAWNKWSLTVAPTAEPAEILCLPESCFNNERVCYCGSSATRNEIIETMQLQLYPKTFWFACFSCLRTSSPSFFVVQVGYVVKFCRQREKPASGPGVIQ